MSKRDLQRIEVLTGVLAGWRTISLLAATHDALDQCHKNGNDGYVEPH